MIEIDNALNSYANAIKPQIESKNLDHIDKAALKEQTDAFEAFLIKEILDIAIKPDNPLFPKDAGNKIYSSMYNDTMSRALSGSMGFSELLYNFLLERAK